MSAMDKEANSINASSQQISGTKEATNTSTSSVFAQKRISGLSRLIKSGINKILLIIIFLVLIGGIVYFYTQYRNSKIEIEKLTKDQDSLASLEAKKLVDTVAELIVLPDESPTVATITDITKLKHQEFFANAKNGDKVLIYNQSKKAILYRPSVNKIIDIAPVNLGGQHSQETATGQAQLQIQPYEAIKR